MTSYSTQFSMFNNLKKHSRAAKKVWRAACGPRAALWPCLLYSGIFLFFLRSINNIPLNSNDTINQGWATHCPRSFFCLFKKSVKCFMHSHFSEQNFQQIKLLIFKEKCPSKLFPPFFALRLKRLATPTLNQQLKFKNPNTIQLPTTQSIQPTKIYFALFHVLSQD